MTDGKKQDVLIKNLSFEDPKTGLVVTKEHDLTVWADKGMEEIIKSVPGVVFCYGFHDVQYSVTLDPRYDPEYVKAEIEAAILCAGGDK